MPPKKPKAGQPFIFRGRRMEIRALEGAVIVATNPETGRDVSATGELRYLEDDGAWTVVGLTDPKPASKEV